MEPVQIRWARFAMEAPEQPPIAEANQGFDRVATEALHVLPDRNVFGLLIATGQPPNTVRLQHEEFNGKQRG